MAGISNTLCNPTPFDVKIDWHQGIAITIPADGSIDLSGQLGVEQMDDFRDGKPGSEAVKEIMNHYGIFLRDFSRTYESQALDGLSASIRSKESMYNEFVNTHRKNRAQQGISENEEAFEEILRQYGYTKLREEIGLLKSRVNFLRKSIGDEPAAVREKLDPERTLMFTDPPRVFASKMALQMFLNDPGNEKLKRQYESFMGEFNKAEEVQEDE